MPAVLKCFCNVNAKCILTTPLVKESLLFKRSPAISITGLLSHHFPDPTFFGLLLVLIIISKTDTKSTQEMSNLPPPQWYWRPTKLTPGLPTPPVWSRVLWRCFRSFSTLNKKHSFIFLSTLKSYKILNKIISQNKRWLPTAWNVLFLQSTRDEPAVQL